MDSSQPAPPKPVCRAHKFGGSSLADAGRIRHVAGLLLADGAARQVAVTSAMHGTTNTLVALGEAATAGGEWQEGLAALRQRHRDTARELLTHPDAALARIDALCGELAELLMRRHIGASKRNIERHYLDAQSKTAKPRGES